MHLKSIREIDWTLDEVLPGIRTNEVHFGNGAQPIQVALAESSQAPSRAALRTLVQDRKGFQPAL